MDSSIAAAGVTPRMRAELKAGLQELWVASLDDRARLAQRSAVPVLDDLLAVQRGASGKIGSQNRTAARREARLSPQPSILTCENTGVSEGTRTPDIQDHNLAL
jgi:hypothetical protein